MQYAERKILMTFSVIQTYKRKKEDSGNRDGRNSQQSRAFWGPAH